MGYDRHEYYDGCHHCKFCVDYDAKTGHCALQVKECPRNAWHNEIMETNNEHIYALEAGMDEEWGL